MYSKFWTTNLQGNSLNPNHLWIGDDPIYWTSEEKTVTLALIEVYLADQRDGTGAFFPLPLRTTCCESSHEWRENLAGNSAWAFLCVHCEPLHHCWVISGGTTWAGNMCLQEEEGDQRKSLNVQLSRCTHSRSANISTLWWTGIGQKVCFQCWEVYHSFGIKV